MSVFEETLENALLSWFEELGYAREFGPDIAPAPDGSHPERDNYNQVVLVGRLQSALREINPGIPEIALDDAIRQFLNPNIPSLIQANKAIHRWLVEGIPVEFSKDGEIVGDRVWLIDYNTPFRNDFLVVNQFSIKGIHRTRRPDVILFVNGIPISVIELKNPVDENADIWDAYNQIQTYKEQIPDLFQYNEIIVISDGISGRIGSLTSDKERYSAWRTIDGVEIDPLGEMRELETLVKGLFQPDLLIDYVRSFVLFEESDQTVKKIAAYHQFHAVRAAVEETLRATGANGDRKCGVVWHTQGAGKSIEMACYAGKIMCHPDMENPTIIVVTDRNDLDGQLYGTFCAAKDLLRETPQQAEKRKELRDLLNNRPSGGIIFTTIQKFSPDEEEDRLPVLSDRRNIVVVCDEAHRTQYGFEARLDKQTGKIKYGYAQHMRDALPNAAFIAFTGTPVSLEDRDTRAVFGDYIHIYDIEQAEADKATVPIFYEGRLAKLGLKPEETPVIDDEVEELTEDEEEQAAAATKSKWAALEKLVGATPRMDLVAKDLVEHFEQRLTVMDGKAMVVCMSRDICAHLYAAIVKLRPQWHNDDPEKGVIKVIMTGSSSDKPLLRPHVYSRQTKKRLESRFKDESDELKVVLVRDMWLTGFDVPCLHTMYVDKPMKGHNLMQAIARVNRVFKDKPGGLVVDYIGIATSLKEALREYTKAKGKGRPIVPAEEALGILLEKLSVCRGLLHGFDYTAFRVNALALLPGAANQILGLDDGKRRFAQAVLSLTKAFALCCTLDEALKHREEIAFLQAVKAVITKHTTKDKKLYDEQKEHALRQILSRAVVSEGVIDIYQVAGIDRPDIGILSDKFLEEVRNMDQRNLAVELLQRLLRDEIKARFASNVVQNKKFSELLNASLIRYRNRGIESAQVIEELIQMAKEFKQASRRGDELQLNQDEVAFYDALESNEASVRELGEPILRKIAQELADSLRKSVTVDWAVRETVRARLRLLVRRILRKYKYPPDREQEAIDTVLQQAETLSAVWSAT